MATNREQELPLDVFSQLPVKIETALKRVGEVNSFLEKPVASAKPEWMTPKALRALDRLDYRGSTGEKLFRTLKLVGTTRGNISTRTIPKLRSHFDQLSAEAKRRIQAAEQDFEEIRGLAEQGFIRQEELHAAQVELTRMRNVLGLEPRPQAAPIDEMTATELPTQEIAELRRAEEMRPGQAPVLKGIKQNAALELLTNGASRHTIRMALWGDEVRSGAITEERFKDRLDKLIHQMRHNLRLQGFTIAGVTQPERGEVLQLVRIPTSDKSSTIVDNRAETASKVETQTPVREVKPDKSDVTPQMPTQLSEPEASDKPLSQHHIRVNRQTGEVEIDGKVLNSPIQSATIRRLIEGKATNQDLNAIARKFGSNAKYPASTTIGSMRVRLGRDLVVNEGDDFNPIYTLNAEIEFAGEQAETQFFPPSTETNPAAPAQDIEEPFEEPFTVNLIHDVATNNILVNNRPLTSNSRGVRNLLISFIENPERRLSGMEINTIVQNAGWTGKYPAKAIYEIIDRQLRHLPHSLLTRTMVENSKRFSYHLNFAELDIRVSQLDSTKSPFRVEEEATSAEASRVNPLLVEQNDETAAAGPAAPEPALVPASENEIEKKNGSFYQTITYRGRELRVRGASIDNLNHIITYLRILENSDPTHPVSSLQSATETFPDLDPKVAVKEARAIRRGEIRDQLSAVGLIITDRNLPDGTTGLYLIDRTPPAKPEGKPDHPRLEDLVDQKLNHSLERVQPTQPEPLPLPELGTPSAQPVESSAPTAPEVKFVEYQPRTDQLLTDEERSVLELITESLVKNTRLYYEQIQAGLAHFITERGSEFTLQGSKFKYYEAKQLYALYKSAYEKFSRQSQVPALRNRWTDEDRSLQGRLDSLGKILNNELNRSRPGNEREMSLEDFLAMIKRRIDKAQQEHFSGEEGGYISK